MDKEIKVVGAALLSDNQILAVQRSKQMTLPLYWEFPGGKVEAGESKKEALIREIKEELSIDINVLNYINTASYNYDFGRVTLTVYTAEIIRGNIELNEHACKKWLVKSQLPSLNWAPVDRPAVKILSKQ